MMYMKVLVRRQVNLPQIVIWVNIHIRRTTNFYTATQYGVHTMNLNANSNTNTNTNSNTNIDTIYKLAHHYQTQIFSAVCSMNCAVCALCIVQCVFVHAL